MAEIRFELVGLDKIKLKQLAVALSDMHEPMRDAVNWLAVALSVDTKAGKSPSGQPYQKYKDSYIKWLYKKKHSILGKEWLWLTGKMMHGMKTKVRKTEAQVGYWGSTKAAMLANVHHYGRRDGTIPARPWVDWRKGYKEHITDNIFWPWIQKKISESGLGG